MIHDFVLMIALYENTITIIVFVIKDQDPD